jgi:hypothetical protein
MSNYRIRENIMEHVILAQAEYKPHTVKTIYDEGPSAIEQALNDPTTYLLGGILIAVIVIGWMFLRRKG